LLGQELARSHPETFHQMLSTLGFCPAYSLHFGVGLLHEVFDSFAFGFFFFLSGIGYWVFVLEILDASFLGGAIAMLLKTKKMGQILFDNGFAPLQRLCSCSEHF
ncbi:MAG: hypothetical protein V7K27_09845, partial [Nostoc sp.]|uniref:hypothetical protein n=1 Tax=Nostoc sp. TaxID=1180 RepID=UPI002FF8E71D